MAIKPYLQLVRLPNVFTAAADSLAGYLLVGGSLGSPERYLPLMGASMALYAGGMVLNDVFDYGEDLRERPFRPLPSGTVNRSAATIMGALAVLLGPVLASFAGGHQTLLVALALGACVLAYDAGGKRLFLGPVLMGSCRGLNLLLGASLVPSLGGQKVWLAACALAVFVAGITWISRAETRSGRSPALVAGWVVQNLGLLGLMLAASALRLVDSPASGSGLLLLLVVAALVNRASTRALNEPVPARIQSAVKTAVLSLVWLDVALVAAARGPLPALAVAALWVPAFLLARWLYTT